MLSPLLLKKPPRMYGGDEPCGSSVGPVKFVYPLTFPNWPPVDLSNSKEEEEEQPRDVGEALGKKRLRPYPMVAELRYSQLSSGNSVTASLDLLKVRVTRSSALVAEEAVRTATGAPSHVLRPEVIRAPTTVDAAVLTDQIDVEERKATWRDILRSVATSRTGASPPSGFMPEWVTRNVIPSFYLTKARQGADAHFVEIFGLDGRPPRAEPIRRDRDGSCHRFYMQTTDKCGVPISKRRRVPTQSPKWVIAPTNDMIAVDEVPGTDDDAAQLKKLKLFRTGLPDEPPSITGPWTEQHRVFARSVACQTDCSAKEAQWTIEPRLVREEMLVLDKKKRRERDGRSDKSES